MFRLDRSGIKRSGPLGVRLGVFALFAPFVGVFEPVMLPLLFAECEGVNLAAVRREGEQFGVLFPELTVPQLPCELGNESEMLDGK